MKPLVLTALLFHPFMISAANAEKIGDVAGRWRTVRHGALVDIVDCGNGSPCGTLAWVSEATFQSNTKDIRNRDLSQRNRKLIGVPILWGFQPDEFTWQNGNIYNPEDGKTFRANIQLLSKNEIRVTGCLGHFAAAKSGCEKTQKETNNDKFNWERSDD